MNYCVGFRRHLCEFTGLDFEMEIDTHYHEVLKVLHGLFRHISAGLESEKYRTEMELIRAHYPHEPFKIPEEPLIVHWDDAIAMLLGELIREKYDSDFFILGTVLCSVCRFVLCILCILCVLCKCIDI